MKREYSTPVVEFEAYSLTTQVALSCKEDPDKTAIGDAKPITITNTKVHCVIGDTTTAKNCSDDAHTWTVTLNGTIFADGNKVGGCDYDCYTQEQYVDLLQKSLESGSTVSGGECSEKTHFCFKGSSHQHTGSFEVADYAKFFES